MYVYVDLYIFASPVVCGYLKMAWIWLNAVGTHK